METCCIACHAPGGLHTADCARAFRAAYAKASLDAAALCEELGYGASTHSATEIALTCALSIKAKAREPQDIEWTSRS